ncbi:hypothetical protein ACFX13_043165 [Malus domestica]
MPHLRPLLPEGQISSLQKGHELCLHPINLLVQRQLLDFQDLLHNVTKLCPVQHQTGSKVLVKRVLGEKIQSVEI